MAVEVKHVDGENKGNVKLYALSTCIWCGKTKKLLGDLNVEYDCIDVDLLDYEEQQQVLEEVKKHNPAGGFPTMVIDDKECIVGFDEQKIRDKFGG
ncbi:MAG: glutaredoxin family protein [Actinobacteria bacterium]|nr:glutaredoxin family protein [Actinomycetota bacterium]MBM3712203.1 glutaredoxin family protein [Actinomycetota bacterium]